MGTLLSASNLHVEIASPTATVHAVRGVSLSIDEGEVFCLVGESGCGKSMTALSVMNLLPPGARLRADELSFEGRDLRQRHAHPAGDRMAMIFQEPMTALNPLMTIGRQLTEGYRHHRRSGRLEAEARACEMLALAGIDAPRERLRAFPHQLSGGQRQRVMIAMALMTEPRLLVADEPTTALDATTQAQILRLLAKLRCDLGLAILLITHDLGVVARLGDRVGVMYAGEIVEEAPVTAFFKAPRHPYSRGLLACLPVPGLTAPGTPLGVIPGSVASPADPAVECRFRPRCAEADPACAAPIPFVRRDGHGWRCVVEAQR